MAGEQSELKQEPIPPEEVSGGLDIALHLLNLNAFKGGPREFPYHLDLTPFEKFMRQLHGQREILTMNISPGNKAIQIKPVNIEAEAEVAKAVFYNVKTGDVDATDTIRGDHSSVRSAFIDAYGEDKLPLLEMHTHPTDALPSVIDYQLMLLGNPETKTRAIRAILVLCPKRQILALATDETPVLLPGQLNELMTQWAEPDRRYEGPEGNYLKTLENRIAVVETAMGKIIQAVFKRGRKRLEEDLNRIAQGLEPEEKKDEEKREEEESMQLTKKAGRVAGKVFAKYGDYISKAFAKTQLQFVQEMGIKLYTSTNFRDFESSPDQLVTSNPALR